MASRRLSLELNLDSGNFSAKMRDAGRETEVFNQKVITTDRTLQKIERGVNGATARLRDFTLVMGNLRSAVENARFFFTGLAEAAVTASAEIERTAFLLKGLSKEATEFGRNQEARQNLEGLIETAKSAPFSIKALSDTFVKFKAGGLDPTNGSMQALLDAVAAFGGSDELLHRASVAIQQMGGKGVISMEELRQQLGEAVPTAIELMAKGLGTTYEKLVDEIAKGKVRAGPALAAMFEQFQLAFGGKAEAMMNTFQGRVSQLKTSLTELAMAFTGVNLDGTTQDNSFFDVLKEQIEALTKTVSSSDFREFAADIGEGMGAAARGLADLVALFKQVGDAIPFLADAKAILLTIVAVLTAKLAGSFVGKMASDFAEAREKMVGVSETNRKMAVEEQNIANQRVRIHQNVVASINERIVRIEAERAAIMATITAEQAKAKAAAAAALSGRNASGKFTSKAAAAAEEAAALARIKSAQDALSVSTNNLTAAKTRLSGVNTSLMASQVAATNATRAATIAKAAMARGAIAAGVAIRGLSSAMAFLGGPWGIAIMAIAGAFAYMSSEAAKTKRAVDDLRETIDETTDSIRVSEDLLDLAAGKTTELGEAAKDATPLVTAFAGEVGALATALYDLSAASKANAINALMLDIAKIDGDVRKAKEGLTGSLITKSNETNSLNPFAGWGERAAVVRSMMDRKGQDAAKAEINRGEQAIADLEDRVRRISEIDPTKLVTPTMRARAAESLKTEDAPVFDGKGGGKGGGAGKQTSNDKAEGQLRTMREQAEGINAEIENAGKEAAKMRFALDNDPVLLEASAAIRDNLMEAAEEIDAAKERMEGFRAFTGLNQELEQQVRSVSELERQYRLVEEGASEAVRENARYKSGLQESVTVAEKFSAEAQTIADKTAEAARRARELDVAVRALEDMKTFIAETNRTADEVFSQLVGGASSSDIELSKVKRTAEKLAREAFPELSRAILENRYISEGFSAAEASRLADIEMEANAKKRSLYETSYVEAQTRQTGLDAAFEMSKRTKEITRSLMTDRREASRLAMEDEIRATYESLNLASMSAAERKRVEEEYYQYVAALRQQNMVQNNPLLSMAQEWGDLTGNMMEASAQWADDFATQLASGEMNFKQFATSILKQILKIIIQALIAKAIMAAFGMGNTPVPMGGGAQGLTNMGIPAGMTNGSPKMYHDGGIASFNPMKDVYRYHGGGIAGLKPKEVPAILEEGEGVFTKEQMAAMGGGGGSIAVQVNVINESGTKLDAQQQGGGRFDGKGYIIDVIVDAASKPGKMRDALQGARR